MKHNMKMTDSPVLHEEVFKHLERASLRNSHSRFQFSFRLESRGAYGYTPKAFIFSLNNKEGLTPFKSMVKKAHEAIFRGASYGPTFGPGWDIYISNNANSNFNSHTDFGDQEAYTIPSGVIDPLHCTGGDSVLIPG